MDASKDQICMYNTINLNDYLVTFVFGKEANCLPGSNQEKVIKKKRTWVKVTAQPCSLAKSRYLNSCNPLKNQMNNIEYLRISESVLEFKMEKKNEKNHFGCFVFRLLISYLISCIKYNRSSTPVYSAETITIPQHMVINKP